MWSLAKVVSLLVIFGISFLSGISSCVAVLCLIRKYGISVHFKRVVSLLNCFSGGVFFATSILHLLPEAREKMEDALELWGIQSEYPLTEFLTGLGFLFILSFESISHLCCSANISGHSDNKVNRRNHGNEKFSSRSKIVYTKVPTAEEDATDSDECHISDCEATSNLEDLTYQSYSGTTTGQSDKSKRNSLTGTGNRVNKSSNRVSRDDVKHQEDASHIPNGDISFRNRHVSIKEGLTGTDNPHLDPAKSNIRGIILLVALSFHMVFDGLALGLMDEDKKVWTLLLALCVHKILVFLSIGLEIFGLLKSLFRSVVLLFGFALVSPLGIVIGVAVTSDEDKLSEYAAAAILQGIATGTFIYVTFFEILHREYEGDTHDLLKVLCTVLGFALVGAVKLLEGVDL